MLKIFYSSLLFFQTIFSTNYQTKLLDRTNQEQIEQVKQLFLNSPIRSTSKPNEKDLERWIDNDSYDILLAINKKELVCGATIYYISKNQELWIQNFALLPTHQEHGIATKLLKHLELIPNIINIGTRIIQENITFYELFKKLGYMQQHHCITMTKSINEFSIADDKKSNVTIQSLNTNNKQEIESFVQLFDTNEFGGSLTLESMQKLITDQKYKFLAAFNSNNQLCGGLAYKIAEKYWKIHVIAVRKDCRRCGIATELLKALEEQALQKNIKELTLYVWPTNHAAIACYKKFDFTEQEIWYQMVKEMQD